MELLQLEACRGQQMAPLVARPFLAIYSDQHQHIGQAPVQRCIPERASTYHLRACSIQAQSIQLELLQGSAKAAGMPVRGFADCRALSPLF